MEMILFEVALFRMRTSARMVVRSPNAVHSVLYRVVVFVNGSRRRFLLQVEFRARLLRVVYVGAIAVLFRFVVIMLNLSETVGSGTQEGEGRKGGFPIRLASRRRRVGRIGSGRGRTSKNLPRRIQGPLEARNEGGKAYVEWVNLRDTMWGIHGFGQVLYQDGILYVIGAGMVLLVAMLGSIVLTLKVRRFAMAKRQQVDQQRARDADQAIRRVKNKG